MIDQFLDTIIEYGGERINFFIPKGTNAKTLQITTKISEITDIKQKFLHVIDKPLDSLSLKDVIKKNYTKGKPIVILTDDYTRPNIHSRILLPLLYPKLIEFGVSEGDIFILVASGTHRPPTEQEIEKKILGPEIWQKYKKHVIIHNCDDGVEQIGTSSRGTPIYLDKKAVQACLIISMTDSEYHYFAGVAGTVKQFFPGISGRKTIRINHPRMFLKDKGFKAECRLGNTEGNPVIQDMIEMVQHVQKKIPIFCIDAILYNKKIVHLNAGDIISLHKLAVKLLKPLYEIAVDQAADLTIISTGELGINLYQAGKGIHAAWNATKKGGRILLVARCDDGHGNDPFNETMIKIKDMNLNDALNWVIANTCSEETFKIGNQKPVDLLRILKDNQIDMITDMEYKNLKDVFRINGIPKKNTILDTLKEYVQNFLKTNKNPLIYVMADAGIYVVPKKK